MKTNAIGWFDIFVTDLERATKFYQEVFSVELIEINDPFSETKIMSFPTEMTNYGAGGALVSSPHGGPGHCGTLIYFSVPDCAQLENSISKLGGKVIRPKFSIGEFGWITLFEDTEGNLIGLNSRV